MEQEINRYNTPQIILRSEKHYGLDKVDGNNVSFYQLTKDGDNFKRTENKIELPAAQLYKEISDKKTKVVMPSKNFLKEKEFSQNFQPPQMIEKESKTYGLEKGNEQKDKVSYIELEKDGGKFKRTDRKINLEPSQLASDIKEGKIKVLMPSIEKVKENQEKQFIDKFQAPAIIEKDKISYGFSKQEGKDLEYFKLEKHGDKYKRTNEKYITTPSELSKQIKEKQIKVIMPSKEYVQQKEQQQAQANASTQSQSVEKKNQQEIKPIYVKPLTAREKKEVKEAFQENKLENNKHAKHLFQRFDNQLNSIPDTVLGQKLSNHDKLKLLVGDLNDKKDTSFKIEKDKTISYQKGNETGIINTHNSQFSQAQAAKQEQQKDKSLAF